VGARVIGWPFDPADDIERRISSRAALFVAGLGGILDVLQQRVGIPRLGIVVLD
jgi:hypothetical protein